MVKLFVVAVITGTQRLSILLDHFSTWNFERKNVLDLSENVEILIIDEDDHKRIQECIRRKVTTECPAFVTIRHYFVEQLKDKLFPNHYNTYSKVLYTSVTLLLPKCSTILKNIFRNVSTTAWIKGIYVKLGVNI